MRHKPDSPVSPASESGNHLGNRRFTEKTSIMMKKLAFVAALLSLALLGGCAKGGSGPCAVNCPGLTVVGTSGGLSPIGTVGLDLPISFSVTFNQYTSPQPLNWNIIGTSCTTATDPSNPCGYFTSTTTSTASFQGPSSVPSDPSITIVATSQSNSDISGTLPMTIIPDTANVAPVSVSVGAGLTQQYTAVALPDQAPQTFSWSCTVNGSACANFSQDPNISGLAYYRPTSGEECSGCVTISATPTVDPTGCSVNPKNYPCSPSTTSVVSERLSGTYAFQFSGYDENDKAILVAGTFTVAAGGSISGLEDEIAWNGSSYVNTQYTISSGSYAPISGSDPNANNSGTLVLNTGAFPSTFQAVLDGAGNVEMIASDKANGNGSGFAVSSSKNKFNQGTTATFAFGFTGVDASNSRVGYAGLLPTDGISSVSGGLIDVNDNGSATNSVCNSSPCPIAGTYSYNANTNLGHLTLTSPKAMAFDFFVANGTENNNGNNPLYLYAISTDSNPAVLGTMVFQSPKITTYNNAALVGTSVSALTGANGNVALVLGTTDGSSSGSGGTGSFAGTFDWNNSGTITSVPPSAPCTALVCTFGNTYLATNGNIGRYTLQMLGNPNANPAVSAIPFVLYAAGANYGFLLDQSSAAVMTGTMNAQSGPKVNLGNFSASSATGTYAVATSSNSVPNPSSCSSLTSCYTTMNLLLTSPGASVFNITGTENPGNQTFSLPYTLGSDGTGRIGPASSQKIPNYVIYGVTENDFFMMGLDAGVISPILYMAQ